MRLKGFDEESIAAVLLQLNHRDCAPPLPKKEVLRIAASIARYEVGNESFFAPFEGLEIEEVQWLAYPYLPRGAITMLDGVPKTGKSSFTTAFGADLTQGRSPPFTTFDGPGRVLFMSAEDDPTRVILPRLIACGADLSRCRFMSKLFSLDASGLQRASVELQENPADLIMIDPLFTFMGDASSNSATEMASLMAGLRRLPGKRTAPSWRFDI